MATEVKLPDLGDGIESGDILSILVKEGDSVEKDQGIVEIETDKATAEVPTPKAGKVAKIHVKNGDTVKVGEVILTLEEAGAKSESKPDKPKDEAKKEKEEEPAEEEEEESQEEEQPAKGEKKESSKKAAAKAEEDEEGEDEGAEEEEEKPKPPKKSKTTTTMAAPSSKTESAAAIAAGPSIRRFAREVGVELNEVQGSGPGGRITRDDILAVVRQANKGSRGGTKLPAPASSNMVEVDEATGSDKWGPIRAEKLSKIRRTIADKMHESWTTVPRVTNFDDADVTELERIRQSSKRDYESKGFKLTSMPFVIKAVAMALREHPQVNAALDLENGRIIYKQYVNVGIAVDTERGLLVPSLRNADDLSISEIVRGLAEMLDKVRGGSFGIDDLRGSTFTISNLGAIGGTYSTPIVNTPELAILLVGRSRKLPVVIDDQVQVRLMMPLSLSYDHRAVDGAIAARFLNDVIGFLEAPSRLLLAP